MTDLTPIATKKLTDSAEYWLEPIDHGESIDVVVHVCMGDQQESAYIQRKDPMRFDGDDDFWFPADEACAEDDDRRLMRLLGIDGYDELEELFEEAGVFAEADRLRPSPHG